VLGQIRLRTFPAPLGLGKVLPYLIYSTTVPGLDNDYKTGVSSFFFIFRDGCHGLLRIHTDNPWVLSATSVTIRLHPPLNNHGFLYSLPNGLHRVMQKYL